MATQNLVEQEQAFEFTDEDIYQGLMDRIESLNEIRETHPMLAVQVHTGVATLSGTVASSITHHMLIRAAKETPGVKRIIDQLTDDQAICVAIATELATYPTFKALKTQIRVASYLGAVILAGPTLSQVDADQAELISRGVTGVREVLNRLQG
jgi:osmotically-inducible protein OsmY